MTPRPTTLAFLFLLLIARPALGQGTSGVLPDPIADRDLNVYAQRLAMSPQQRLGVDRFHEAYLEESRVLREGPIQEFLDASGNIMRSFMIAPDAKEMRKSLRELDRLNDRIRASDERLFDQIRSVLSEGQAADLPRIRSLRERERLLGGVVRYLTYASPVLRVDLTTLASEVELPPQDRATLGTLLPEYESRLTTAARRLAKETDDMFATIVRRIDELDVDQDRNGRTRQRAAWRELRAIWTDASTGVIDASADLAELNRRSATTLASALTNEGGRSLIDGFRHRAFNDIYAGTRLAIDRYDAALLLPGLEPEQVKAIEAAREVLVLRHDRIAEELMDLVEEMQRQAMLRRFGGREVPEAEAMTTLEMDRDAINEQAIATLDAILGPDGVEALARGEVSEDTKDAIDAAGRNAPPTQPSARRRAPRPRATSESERSRTVGRGPDPFLPESISEDELSACRSRLELSDDQAEVLQSLYQTYLTSFEKLRTERIGPLVERAKNLWTAEPEGRRLLPPGPAAIDALFKERRGVFAVIRATDGAFFEDVELVVIDRDNAAQRDAMNDVRRARDRVTFNIGVDPRTGMPIGSRRSGHRTELRESSLDLSTLYNETFPAADARSRIAPEMDEYERSLVGLLKERYELALAFAEEYEGIRADASHARDLPREQRPDIGSAYRRLFESTGAELRRVSEAIVTLNRGALDSLGSGLTPSAQSTLQAAYRRVANPNVFEDPDAVGPFFRQALDLEGLATDQRSRIGELFAEYRSEYDRLNDALVELDRADADTSTERAGLVWQQRQKRQNSRQRIEFQRSELNEKALRRLRASIDEDQATRLGIGEG